MAGFADQVFPKCNDKRECFGKKHTGDRCGILTKTYEDGMCPFCKPKRSVTNGKTYMHNKLYVGSGK